MHCWYDTKLFDFIFLGDGGIGKTCLLLTYMDKHFPDTLVPTSKIISLLELVLFNLCYLVVDEYKIPIQIQNNFLVELELVDTAGSEDFEEFRKLSLINASAFMFCYSLINSRSLINIEDYWMSEAEQIAPDASFLLVGTAL